MNIILLLLILLLVVWAAYSYGAMRAAARLAATSTPADSTPAVSSEALAALETRLAPMLAITDYKLSGDAIQFTGQLKGKADEMLRKIREVFAADPITPILLEGEKDDVRLLMLPVRDSTSTSERPRWVLPALLFLATLVTTTATGAMQAGVDLLHEPGRFAAGLPYSVGLLLILGAHELGHYFTAKAHGIRVTPPYFIPVPFGLGTFGAFIRIKSLSPDRRALFDVAVAGPLAGLVFAIPALLIGLRFSQVIPPHATGIMPAGVDVGSSALLTFLARLSLGPYVLASSHLLLHPLAFAGWLGLIVTALNLLPIGQLDGGHISHALFGSRTARGISIAAMVLLFLLALVVWPGLLFWALIVFFIAGTRDAPAADDLSPVDPRRRAVGYLTFLLLLLIIVPVPHALFAAISVHFPYL